MVGVKLEEIYNYIESEGGRIAVLRAVIISKIPRADVKMIEHSDETLSVLKNAARKVLNRSNISEFSE